MEKNLHDDRLDDYVKNSFDGYSENPATDMWERIEAELPPLEHTKPVLHAWRGYGWPFATAVVVILALVSRLMCVQYYYEDKIRSISGQQAQASQTKPGSVISAPTVADNNAADHSFTPAKGSDIAITQQAGQFLPTKTTVPANLDKPTTNAGISNEEIISKGSKASPLLQPAKSEVIVIAPVVQTELAPIPEGSALVHDPAIKTEAFATNTTTFETLVHRFPPLSIARNEHPNALKVPVKKYHEASGWYFGLSVTPHLTVEKAQKPVVPGPILNPRRLSTARQNRPQASADISLRVGKKINSRFAIESGVAFQNLSRSATHRALFEYRDGHPFQNPGGLEARRFDYELNTYGGTASVSLRTEAVGSNTPAEQERIGAIITSKESINMLQIPVMGVARLGKGQLKAVVKAGILGTCLMKNSLGITAYRLDNNKLRFRSNDGYAVSLDRPTHFLWGFQAAIGAEFRLNKNLSLAALPTVSGDFQRKVAGLGKLPGHALVGVNLGANWWF